MNTITIDFETLIQLTPDRPECLDPCSPGAEYSINLRVWRHKEFERYYNLRAHAPFATPDQIAAVLRGAGKNITCEKTLQAYRDELGISLLAGITRLDNLMHS